AAIATALAPTVHTIDRTETRSPERRSGVDIGVASDMRASPADQSSRHTCRSSLACTLRDRLPPGPPARRPTSAGPTAYFRRPDGPTEGGWRAPAGCYQALARRPACRDRVRRSASGRRERRRR